MWASNFLGWGNGFCNWGSSVGAGPWFIGWLFPLLFWGGIFYLFFLLIKQIFSRGQSNESDAALEIVRQRYASGEIDQQEFNARKSILASK